ncbi:MAG: hypothetical protein OXC62_03775 [Aestuariivita sp.]|nr:hypothetical protein [Aestuariivita sp.]
MTAVWSIGIPDWQDRLAWIYNLIPEVKRFKDLPATSISGGQQKLVALAGTLMLGKNYYYLMNPRRVSLLYLPAESLIFL